ncbi:hypothetical protein [Haloquadratum walsbyi]|uniref:HTH domain protein n=1 Tax=Haloquadratum walsbyi (strain DSM 16854 / JCM 12705 / C23) TaxID=768065 RepID=G0LMA0_HALWC|nr:hypothetical protein [Haloquadratum walsbyi]CCC41220.1 uncharacterized protein Hqrw_3460 [Haloquadratum walsbyi C23]
MRREQPPGVPVDDNREPSLRDTLDAVRGMDSPGVTTTDIRIILGCSADTARRRLEILFEQGHVDRRKTNQQTLWWEIESEHTEERGAAEHLEPVEGPKTNAVELIEASRDER